MNTLSRQELKEIAWLARLDLSDKELDRFQEQTKMVLTYVASLDQVILQKETIETKNQQALSALRDDTLHQTVINNEYRETRDALLNNAPKAQDSFFVVPQILSHSTEQE